jgi:hypothetical protein
LGIRLQPSKVDVVNEVPTAAASLEEDVPDQLVRVLASPIARQKAIAGVQGATRHHQQPCGQACRAAGPHGHNRHPLGTTGQATLKLRAVSANGDFTPTGPSARNKNTNEYTKLDTSRNGRATPLPRDQPFIPKEPRPPEIGAFKGTKIGNPPHGAFRSILAPNSRNREEV